MSENVITAIRNPHLSQEAGPVFLTAEATNPVLHLHQSVSEYSVTPLVSLKEKAAQLGVKGIYVKDESPRFGLNAFKGLGGIYAITRVICEKLGLDICTVRFEDLMEPELNQQIRKMIFATTTDGNHGKGVAWAAGLLGCQAHVFMPKGTVEVRAQAIRDAGKAEVTITDLNYDDCVCMTKELGAKNGWTLIQDTSWKGYEDIPTWIIQGYSTMVREAIDQLRACGETAPTHVFVQAGVGALAGSVTGYVANEFDGNRPIVSIVEPTEVACIYESAEASDGLPHAATGNGETIMAGLNCGEPCTVAWPILRDFASYYLACPDYVAAEGMRQLANPEGSDERIVSGESGASAPGAAFMILERPEYADLRREMQLNENAVILLFNTEGDTDPENYRAILAGAYAAPQ